MQALHFGPLCEDHRRALDRLHEENPSFERLEGGSRSIWREARTCARCVRVGKERLESDSGRPAGSHSWDRVRLVESRPELSYGFWSSSRELGDILELAGLLPADPVPTALLENLRRIESGTPDRRPAAVRLSDGTSLPRVYFLAASFALDNYVEFWTRFVRGRHLVDILPSPSQIPAPTARKLFAVLETSTGSLEFRLRLGDGSTVTCWYGGASDFVALPEPYTPADIVDVEITRGLASRGDGYRIEPDFVWCVLPA